MCHFYVANFLWHFWLLSMTFSQKSSLRDIPSQDAPEMNHFINGAKNNKKLWLLETTKLDTSSDKIFKKVQAENGTIICEDKQVACASDKMTDIAGLYVPLIKYLRILGLCPLRVERCRETGFIRFGFRLISPLTFYSFCMTTFFGLSSAWMLISYLKEGFCNDFSQVLLVKKKINFLKKKYLLTHCVHKYVDFLAS